MRKGIEKIIESLHKSGIYDYRYEEYLIESSLSLKVIGTINRYYTACVRAGQDFDAVMDEILKYDSLSAGFDIVLSYNWKTGDILLGKDDIKTELLNKCKGSKVKTVSYTILCHYVLPAYINDGELRSLLFELADKWDECVEHEYDAFGFTAKHYCDYKTDHENNVYYADVDIIDLLWNDFVENKRRSVLYRAWSKGYTVNIFDTIAYGSHNMTRSFGKRFADYIKASKGNLSDNLMMYFAFVDGVRLCGRDKTETKVHSLDFDYETALADLNEGSVCNAILKSIQDISPDYARELDEGIQVYDKVLVDKMREVCNNDFSVSTPYFKIKCVYSDSGILNVYLKKYPRVQVLQTSQDRILGVGKPQELDLFINKDNQAFYKYEHKSKSGKTSWFPLSLKKLAPFLGCEAVVQFFDTLSATTGNMLIKDVIKDIMECGDSFISPISYADTVKYHNRAEYFTGTYKNAGIIKWNYNKHNINLSYMVLKSLDKVAIEDYGILQNTSDNMLRYIKKNQHGRNKLSNTIIEFLSGFYAEKGAEAEDYAEDYIRMCVNEHKDVVLHYSAKRMIDEHDHFMDNRTRKSYNKQVKPFKVPKNSKFNKLRDILPEGFEWVKTKKRLIDESIMMHHCVWSYYDKIGRDACAIYSFLDKQGMFDCKGKGEVKRYTIEFLYDKRSNNYRINQIQTKYDRFGGDLIKPYIQKLLNP